MGEDHCLLYTRRLPWLLQDGPNWSQSERVPSTPTPQCFYNRYGVAARRATHRETPPSSLHLHTQAFDSAVGWVCPSIFQTRWIFYTKPQSKLSLAHRHTHTHVHEHTHLKPHIAILLCLQISVSQMTQSSQQDLTMRGCFPSSRLS